MCSHFLLESKQKPKFDFNKNNWHNERKKGCRDRLTDNEWSIENCLGWACNKTTDKLADSCNEPIHCFTLICKLHFSGDHFPVIVYQPNKHNLKLRQIVHGLIFTWSKNRYTVVRLKQSVWAHDASWYVVFTEVGLSDPHHTVLSSCLVFNTYMFIISDTKRKWKTIVLLYLMNKKLLPRMGNSF